MGRNKYPEQTVEKILSVSSKLFVEKGYDKTSVQDILDALGISKGGLYHHFKSKEEILDAVIQRHTQHAMGMLYDLIQNTEARNVKEKLQKIILTFATDTKTHEINTVLSSQIKNPQFVVSGVQNSVNIDAPIIAKLIEEGNRDGSFQTDDPALCAEVFLLLSNTWINPILFNRDSTETERRLKYLQKMMRSLGVDIVTDELIAISINEFERMGGFYLEKE